MLDLLSVALIVWDLSITVPFTYQLKQCKVLLPPQVLLVLRPHGGQHIVGVHNDVDYIVHKIRKCPMSSWNAMSCKCLTVTKFSLHLFESNLC